MKQLAVIIYCLCGKPCCAAYGKWWKRLRPKRLTLYTNPAIYGWLWWNFSWDKRVL